MKNNRKLCTVIVYKLEIKLKHNIYTLKEEIIKLKGKVLTNTTNKKGSSIFDIKMERKIF